VELSGSHSYNAPLESLLEMLSNPDAVAAKYHSMNQRDVKVEECDRREDSLRVVSSRVMDVDLPSFAKKVFRPTNTARQTDQWTRRDDGVWEGIFHVEIRGAPVHIQGTMTLTPQDGRTVYDITAAVEVKVPLVGGRLADWLGNSEVRRSIESESAFYDWWLQEHR